MTDIDEYGCTEGYRRLIQKCMNRRSLVADDEESDDDAEDLDPEVTAYYEAVERCYEDYVDRHVLRVM